MNVDQSSAWELAQLDAVGQAELVHTRAVSARELVEAAIVRIEAVNDEVNAVVHRRYDQALADAEAVKVDEGLPFAGVPFLVKDDGECAQAGVPQTRGNGALKEVHYTAAADTPLGRRVRESGLITVGVSNMPEFGQQADTQPIAFGPTRNPWCLDRTVGGSSGGSAAAVALGLVPVAHASDGGGSIRIPAAACGVVGLKPSRGRTPRPLGRIDDIWISSLVVSRTVRDTAAALDAVNGALPGDLYALPEVAESFLGSLTERPSALRVGLLAEAPPGMPLNVEYVHGVERVGSILEGAGHHVEVAHPSALLEEVPAWVNEIGLRWGGRSMVADLEELLGRPVNESDFEPYTWRRYLEDKPTLATDLLAFDAWHLERAGRLVQWWETGYDLLVTPVLNELPEPLADLAANSPAQARQAERRHVAYLEAFNASGQPAISLPVRWTEDDIPVGVQVVAAKGEDRLLLQIAAQIEEACDWQSEMPRILDKFRGATPTSQLREMARER